MAETYTGTVAEASFVRAGDALLCQTCSDDQGDPTGDYCCECCNERDRRPGTYLTVRLDQEDARVGVGRVTVSYTDAEPALVKPSREDVARTLFQWDIAPDHPQPHPLWDDPHSARLRDLWLSAADAVLALLPGRAVEEVKAEALEEAADSPAVWGVLAANSLHVSGVRSWLRHRAAALLRGESHV